MSIVELKGIYTAYEGGEKAVIRDLSLRVDRGEYVVIGGPNSAGKTTLLESINGLIKITHGSATVCGLNVSSQADEVRKRVGYVIQNFYFDPFTPFTVEQVVMMGRFGRLGLMNRPAREDYDAAQRAISLVGIEDLAHKTIGTCSGGQQQKAMIAHNIAKEPEVMMLDEPFSNLDFHTREYLQGVFKDNCENRSSHPHGGPCFRRSSRYSHPPGGYEPGQDHLRHELQGGRSGRHHQKRVRGVWKMLEWMIENNVVCHALEAMIFASIACSILGVIISRMSLSSIGFTMSHAAFAGAALGMFLGVNAQMSAIAFSMAVAALIGPVSDKAKMAADATLGVLFAMSMAVAIFLISYMEYMGKGLSASALLFGDVISLYREEIYALAAVCCLTIIFVLAFYKEISAIMFNMKIAEAAGVRVKLVYYILLFIIALSVALSLNIVGGLLDIRSAGDSRVYCRSVLL